MTAWTCVRCGRPADAARLRPTLSGYMFGFCIDCKVRGVFTSAPHIGPNRGQARHTDPDTSQAAAAKIRPNSAKAALLEAHRDHPSGLTDEEAARLAGLSLASEYATRCSELTRAGLLEVTEQRRDGAAGMDRIVRRIVA